MLLDKVKPHCVAPLPEKDLSTEGVLDSSPSNQETDSTYARFLDPDAPPLVSSIDRTGEADELIEASKHGDLHTVQTICERQNVSPEIRGYMGWTPAHWAAREGHICILKYLKEIGTNLEHVDNRGDTLLHKAASNAQYETIVWLLENGFNVQAENNNGINPVTVARELSVLTTNKKKADRCAQFLVGIDVSTF